MSRIILTRTTWVAFPKFITVMKATKYVFFPELTPVSSLDLRGVQSITQPQNESSAVKRREMTEFRAGKTTNA